MTAVSAAQLRAVDLFDGLDEAELEEWARVATCRELAAGEIVADQGIEPLGVMLVLEGTLATMRIDHSGAEPVDRHEAPTWMGAIAVMTEMSLPVRVQALTACRLAVVAPEDFRRLVHVHLSVHDRVMRQIAPVYARVSAIDANRERLTSLGTMAAGLAHELNNPVAAARRTAAELVEALGVVNGSLARFVEAGVERSQAERLIELQRDAVARAADATTLDALAAADAEDELLAALEELGVGEAWRIAEPLAAAGVDREWLGQVSELSGPVTEAVLRWIAATLSAGRLAGELEKATGQMSSLVGAIKTYAYADRGEVADVDLHECLETTVTLLGHKLKHCSIHLQRSYDPALPTVTANGPALNQVWTNLLDNAMDAVADDGTIAITTSLDGDCAVVEITDDGPGIPAAVRDRIFDPFFTTKDVGSGTGLGLSTARSIVVERHHGSIAVDSRPGQTTFRVRLPLANA